MSSERFTEVTSYKVRRMLKTKIFKSNLSGMLVCCANVSGPVVNGYFCLATKCFDDEGLPHTLEHLVFSGSKAYPYKGVLDVLANRCFAQGTNAWTSLDHTCYTVESVSSEGFLNLLPVYLDHILFPIFGDEEFKTEIYCKQDDNEETGVVFSEMKARENSKGTILQRTMMKLLYPKSSGYTKISGGLVNDIPKLTIDKIKAYHKKYYIPQNIMIVVCGDIQEKQLLNKVANYEDSVKDMLIADSLFERPWIDPIPLLTETIIHTTSYPSEDLSTGAVWISFCGANVNDPMAALTLEMLLAYLTMQEHGAIWKLFNQPEIIVPSISSEISQFRNSYPVLILDSVSIDNMPKVADMCRDQLKKLAESDGIDMNLMMPMMNSVYMKRCENFENAIHEKVITAAVQYYLFGESPSDASKYINEPFNLRKLMTQPKEYWDKIFIKHFVEGPMAVLMGYPQETQTPKQNSGENTPTTVTPEIKKEKENLFGITKLFHTLLWKSPDKPQSKIPDSLLTNFQIPDMEDLAFHHISTASNFGKCGFNPDLLTKFELSKIPFPLQLDDITSDFIEITIAINTLNLEPSWKKYIPFFAELPFSLPIKHKDRIYSLDEVLLELNKISLSYGASLGWCGGTFQPGIFAHYYFITMKSAKENYREVLHWIHDLLFNFVPDVDKMKELINRMMVIRNNMAESGSRVVDALFRSLSYNKQSNIYNSNIILQNKVLNELNDLLENNPDELKESLKMIRKSFVEPDAVKFHLSCDFEELIHLEPSPHEIWLEIFPEYSEKNQSNIVTTPSTITRVELNFDYSLNYICGMGSIDCSFLNQALPIVISYRHHHFPALLVLLEYLAAAEGPMWKALRGNGLCYGFKLFVEPSDGVMHLNIFRSIDISAAYEETLKIFKQFSQPDAQFNTAQLEAAISGVIFSIASEESTVDKAANQKFLSQMKGINEDFHRNLMKMVSRINQSSVQEVAKEYLPAFLKADTSHLAITCPSSKVDEIIENFKKFHAVLTPIDVNAEMACE